MSQLAITRFKQDARKIVKLAESELEKAIRKGDWSANIYQEGLKQTRFSETGGLFALPAFTFSRFNSSHRKQTTEYRDCAGLLL